MFILKFFILYITIINFFSDKVSSKILPSLQRPSFVCRPYLSTDGVKVRSIKCN